VTSSVPPSVANCASLFEVSGVSICATEIAISFLVELQFTIVEGADSSSSTVPLQITMSCEELSSIVELAVTIEAYVAAIAEVLFFHFAACGAPL
jgi:hypothetical protein